MTKTITFLLATLFVLPSFGQAFEGKIVYQSTYKSKTPNMTDEQFTAMLGSAQEYFINNGDYKTVTNGSLVLWQLYVNKDNKLYSKMSNAETVFWNDGAVNPDEVLKTAINKNVTEIRGYQCDEVVLTCKSGLQKYYFNTKLSVDINLFTNHKFGNWYDYLSKANALPLKMNIDNAQLTFESVATEVTPMKLDETFFELPANITTTKSPY